MDPADALSSKGSGPTPTLPLQGNQPGERVDQSFGGNTSDDMTPPAHPPQQRADAADETVNIPKRTSGGGNLEDRSSQQRSASGTVDPSDRVYPIRSVVSVDQSQPLWISSRTNANRDLDYSGRSETWHGRRRPSFHRLETDSIVSEASGTSDGPSRVSSTPLSRSLVTSPHDRDQFFAQRSRRSIRPSSKDGPASSILPAPLFSDNQSYNSEDEISEDGGSSRSGLQPASQRSSILGLPNVPNEDLVATRFQYVTTNEGYAVITGIDDTLQRCEDEPIHMPGAVQSFGLLIAIREESNGQFAVRMVSENSKDIIGYTPQQLFRLISFTEIFSKEQQENLLDHIDFIRDGEADPATNGPEVFSLSLRPPNGKSIKLWCAMHIPSSHPDLVVCEFELEDDKVHPLRPSSDTTPTDPADTLYQNPTVEEFNDSTEVFSKPLRVLRNARRKRTEAGAMQVFDIMSQVQEQLSSASDLHQFLKILVGIVKELTGFHRVMIYQFDSAFNGKVVTELVDPAQTRDMYQGLHFPASDIPKQARDLYKLNKVRLLYDRDLESARMVCCSMEDLEKPLDMSHSYLRAMSPIHLKYLTNMTVRASMSISVNAFDELWGLIACHSYGSKGMRVPFPIRKMCRLVGDTASRNIERLSYAMRLQSRKLINTVPTDRNPSGYIIASSEDLLKLFGADSGVLSIRGETKILGTLNHSQEALALLEYLRVRKLTSVVTSQDIKEDLPDLKYPPGFSIIAGLLYVPLSAGGQDFIVFFRQGQVREVKWAGNPYEKVVKDGTAAYLEPRYSFKAWHETVVGKCREWTEEQVETAAVLCLVYGKFIEVWREKEAALQSSQLTRLLLANSAHEVRTPLNAIINYLEIALEGSLDQEIRESLVKSHSASKSLIYVINDLLDLTKTEEGHELVRDEILDLPMCLAEATEPFKVDTKRKGIEYEIINHPGLPQYVHGDYRRVRQAIANLTANAVEFTAQGSIKVESYVVEMIDNKAKIEIVVQDTGCGMSNDRLDSLFRELEQVSTDLNNADKPDDKRQPQKGQSLGLGLAMVARIVRNMQGQLRLKSAEGKGSRFVVQLPFILPDNDTSQAIQSDISDTKSSVPSVTKSLPPVQSGEVLLVDRDHDTPVEPSSLTKRTSMDFDDRGSCGSIKSFTSKASGRSSKSDAERLIEAIQTPLSVGEAEPASTSLQRYGPKSSVKSVTSVNTDLCGSTMAPHSGDQSQMDSVRPSSSSAIPSDANPTAGIHYVNDSKTPIRSIKFPDDYVEPSSVPQITQPSTGVLFEIPSKPRPRTHNGNEPQSSVLSTIDRLRVLIAEDDPINMKIMKKRLEKAGHDVSHSVNGEDCATVYKAQPQNFDIILMDMQMPIVDGLTSTKLIRTFEQPTQCDLSPLAKLHGRIPIIAVSASLVERERLTYIDAGFDGWILKPVDFKRLTRLLAGITDDSVRNDCLYIQGEWERGGWFMRRVPGIINSWPIAKEGADPKGNDDTTTGDNQ